VRTGDVVRQHGGTVRVTVRVQPRASRAAVEGTYGDAIRVRVQAPPVEGAANDAVCELLAATLGLARRHVRVVTGASSRTKTIEIEGLSADVIRSRLTAATETR
jgi:uncharacterized protein (TIGR00251 family)